MNMGVEVINEEKLSGDVIIIPTIGNDALSPAPASLVVIVVSDAAILADVVAEFATGRLLDASALAAYIRVPVGEPHSCKGLPTQITSAAPEFSSVSAGG